MALTPAQRKLRARRHRVMWGTLLYLVCAIPALVWAAGSSPDRLAWGLGAFMLVGVIWVGGLFVAYRCPRCGEPLGEDASNATNRIEWMVHLLAQPVECPRCGLSDREDDA